ncbi:hypothetical protein MJA45_27570 [Paenibacillus aurantius]|uniref:Uncharacterized protein n=1 Tax=Paenibacillus aurantius TaxID=2918900 RepID=A0AA96LE31_9BACL|nr:hypothetical protein [Paenibacillus aurantius]WNQ11313.1 hypothetical protein MJA45_27570 [Paenibacillus aurantius]
MKRAVSFFKILFALATLVSVAFVFFAGGNLSVYLGFMTLFQGLYGFAKAAELKAQEQPGVVSSFATSGICFIGSMVIFMMVFYT